MSKNPMRKDKDFTDFKKRRASKKVKEEILKELFRLARELHVGIEFKYDEVEEMGAYLDGSFDPTCYQIKLYRPLKEKSLSLYTLFVFAHELRHAMQFKENLKPDAWFYYMGGTFDEPEGDCNWLEDDADSWAARFIGQFLE